MSKVNILLTEANGNLSGQKSVITEAIREAEAYVFPKLKIDWDIDLLITNRLYEMLIPEDGVGGRTWASDFIEFAINEKKVTKDLISEMVAHELCHAARWGKNDEWANSLFDAVISEGIATYLEAEYVKDREEKTVFLKTVLSRTDAENEKILEILRPVLDHSTYDYAIIFFTGFEDLPRWSGYSLGYYLVKRYLERTGKQIADAFTDRYADFKSAT